MVSMEKGADISRLGLEVSEKQAGLKVEVFLRLYQALEIQGRVTPLRFTSTFVGHWRFWYSKVIKLYVDKWRG